MQIDRLLASHDGVVSRDQARACGLSEDQISGRVARGEWLRRASAVYFAVAWAWTPAAAVRVAAKCVRKRALVADGWTVMEVTWEDLERRPAEVVDQIRRALLHLAARTR